MKNILSPFVTLDTVFYGIAIMAGVAIVLTGNMEPSASTTSLTADKHLVEVISRMDAIGSQLARWEEQDTAQYR